MCLVVNPEAPCFLITTSKILMRFNVLFLEGLQPQNVFIFHETFVQVNSEHSSRSYNSLIFTWHERATRQFSAS